MKANELMIGDWVHSSFFGKTRVTSSKEYEGYGWVVTSGSQDWKADASLSPIPITAEILEKNGFYREKQTFINDLTWVSDDGQIIFSKLSNWKEWNVHFDNECFESIGNIECDYVHELQHALRLCGLNEFADDFKVV